MISMPSQKLAPNNGVSSPSFSPSAHFACPWKLEGAGCTARRNFVCNGHEGILAACMKLLPSRPESLSQAFHVPRSLASVQAPVRDSTRLAFFARMAVYSRSLSSDPPSTPTPTPSGSGGSSTSISTNTIIAGVLGGVAVLLLCAGIFIVVRLRHRNGSGLWARFPWLTSGTGTASSQRTLCNSEGGIVRAQTAQARMMKGKASFMSEQSQVDYKSRPSVEEEEDITSIEYTPRRTHSKRRPTIVIDTEHLPSKYRKSSMDSRSCYRETKGGTSIGPLSESDFDDETAHRNSMLSTYTLSLQLSRPSTSHSQVSVQTVSPIAFCDTPSNSHLPLALRPKNVIPTPEQGQPDLEDTKDPTAPPSTSI